MYEVLKLRAGERSDGSLVQEEVLAEPQGGGRFAILRSPGLVLDLAAGDIVEVFGAGEFQTIQRGQNVCIQVFVTDHLARLEQELTREFKSLGGRLDGKAERELVYTAPVSAGFEAIQRVLNSCVGRFAGAEWYFGNVYDPVDGVTPLNWWIADTGDPTQDGSGKRNDGER